jgi:signal transduction histidine kinase/DNA-binding response OmpR family regulator
MNRQPHSSDAFPVRILIVDDHPSMATTLARAVSQLGPKVEVVSATGGREALERVQGGAVDILITDMIMPEMNGLELVEKLQNHPGGKPAYIILITAYDVPGLKETSRRLKVNEVIIKPVRPERICQIVSNAMKSMGHSPAVEAAAEPQPFKILIADDMPDNVTLLSRYMKSEGYSYITACNGVEALEKTRAEMPDLVLLDVNMPEKDGFAVLAEMRADPAIEYLPVIIFTSARLHPDDIQAGLNLGADDYITKPFDRRELFARIRAKLRTKAFEDAMRRRNRELSILPEIGKELSARLNINELLSIVLRRSVETLGAISGYIFIINPGGAPLKKSYSASDIEMEFPKLDAFLGEIEENRQGLIVSDTRKDKRWQAGQINLLHSAVIVPMFGRNTLLGLLVLAHENENYFESEHLLLLQAIASQAAIAIENAQLYEDVAQQQKRLSAVLQSAAEAIFVFDAEGRLNLLNPAGEKLFTDFNARLNHPLEAGHGYDALIQMLEEARVSEFTKSGEIAWPDKRTFVALITPIESGGLVAILHDVTRFKDVERVKNEFIATASHDLKNPITSIAGYSELLAQAGPLNEIQSDFAHRIQTAARAMSELVQNMLELAQVDLNAAQKHESVELGALLAGVADEFTPQATARKQTLKFDPLTVPARVNGDPLQLKQLFRNLIGNAIKYTPSGGRIILSAKVGKENIQVKVQDTGFGIPAADLPFVFDRFYRVRNGKHSEIEGNGLGLAIVKSVTEQHGGQVSVESEPDKGSRFNVSLPIFANAEYALPEPAHISTDR